MDDLCRRINCKHITWSNGGGDSVTCWLECKLKKEHTDCDRCANCKDRVPKYIMSDFNSQPMQNQHKNCELKPCPFCGSAKTRYEGYWCSRFNGFYVRCLKCDASSSAKGTKRAAKKAWNTRTQQKEVEMAECKYCVEEICVNADCPMVADYCPVPDIPSVCKYEDRDGKLQKEG